MILKSQEINDIIEQHTIDTTPEDKIVKGLTKEVFFQIIKESEIDLEKLVQKRKKNDYLPFHNFNFILKQLYKSKKISIVDAAIYLETDMFNSKEIFGCLNEENMYELRKTLAERNNISLQKTKLDLFLKGKKDE